MTVDASTFRSILGRFASGVTVVTAVDGDGQDHGMTATAFCSVSLVPPLILICVDHTATMDGVLAVIPTFAINVLSADQETLSRRFGTAEVKSGGMAEEERFIGIGYTRGVSGAALIDDALAHLECRVYERHQAGDHTIVVGEVEAAAVHEARPLLYYRGGYAQLER
jgi:flavin reductase (DIM6/NTAB) family NADH-FMN oxidoreductase RutF